MWREFFRYSYIPVSDSVIRLLSLVPGNKNDPLRGSFEQGHVGTLPKKKYEALSYSWGPQDKPCYIELVEGRIPITFSLHGALVRLRGKSKGRLLWADAICINQDDIVERSQQILLMPQIYSSAFRVVAYLGEEADGSDLALQLLKNIGETDFSSLPELAVTPEWLEESGLPGFKDPKWIALEAFWCRPWFQRIWVVQEVILAQDILMICGRQKISWKTFVSAAEKTANFNLLRWSSGSQDTFKRVNEAHSGSTSMLAMMGVKSSSNLGSSLAYYVRSFCEGDIGTLHQLNTHHELDNILPGLRDLILVLRQAPEMVNLVVQLLVYVIEACGVSIDLSRSLSMFELLLLFDASKASDLRDRFYALVGLAKDCKGENFRPNYSEENKVEHVVHHFTLAFIHKDQGMKALHLAGLSSEPSPLPSWVPDWTGPGLLQRKSLCARGILLPSASYSAATDSPFRIRIGDTPNVLVVSGSLMDIVSWVGMDASGLWSPNSSDLHLLKPFFDEADEIIPPDPEVLYAATGESMFDAQWRTLIGNRAMNVLGLGLGLGLG